MQPLVCYKKLSVWNNQTLPSAFMEKHNTKVGTWAKLNILQGSLNFVLLTENGEVTHSYHFSVTNQPPFIEPQQWHKIVSVSDDFQGQLSFYCEPTDYVSKKYDMTKTHSEVIEAVNVINPCKILDLGCGSGRNSLFLNLLGFNVTALDKSQNDIARLNHIIESESLKDFQAECYDINQATLNENYDFIISTVVMMFLDSNQIPAIITNMQEHTVGGGYNLIVAAMSTEDYPCPLPFSFTFKENELKNYYQDWQIIKYNENVGALHKVDQYGNPIKLRFATLLAKKI